MIKKTGKLARHMVNLNIAIDSLLALQISLGIIAYLKRFMMESRFLQSSQSSQTSGRMDNTGVYDEKSVTQPDTVLLLGNNY
jgi:hypothetical protein